MATPIFDDQLNVVRLKPRFKIQAKEGVEELIEKFSVTLKKAYPEYRSKVIGNHIVVDVPKLKETFWSPQLHTEIIAEEGITYAKGILGPKPIVWTFFMFLHFVVAFTFIIYFVIFYSKWSLGKEYTLAMYMCLLMPVIWIIFYFGGQLGKRKGYAQMQELHNILNNIIHA
jgi:ABC-type multidrug transport system fused ATPase/permease subunit